MPMITTLVAVALFVLTLAAGLAVIVGVAYWLTRNDIRKQDRAEWLATLAKSVVVVLTTVISAGTPYILFSHFLSHFNRGGPSG